jgi:hypothetical protein
VRAARAIVLLVLAACGTSEEPPPTPAPSLEKAPAPQRVACGPATVHAHAVATDRTSDRRERRDWFVWATSGADARTYVAEFVGDLDVTADETECARRPTELMAAVAPSAR